MHLVSEGFLAKEFTIQDSQSWRKKILLALLENYWTLQMGSWDKYLMKHEVK